MSISRDGQAGEGRKGSMKEREGKERADTKQVLDFDSSALGGRALPKAPVFFPSQSLGMKAASFPLKLLEDCTGAGHFPALPTKPSIHA